MLYFNLILILITGFTFEVIQYYWSHFHYNSLGLWWELVSDGNERERSERSQKGIRGSTLVYSSNYSTYTITKQKQLNELCEEIFVQKVFLFLN